MQVVNPQRQNLKRKAGTASPPAIRTVTVLGATGWVGTSTVDLL
jgi:hypothetical protein